MKQQFSSLCFSARISSFPINMYPQFRKNGWPGRNVTSSSSSTKQVAENVCWVSINRQYLDSDFFDDQVWIFDTNYGTRKVFTCPVKDLKAVLDQTELLSRRDGTQRYKMYLNYVDGKIYRFPTDQDPGALLNTTLFRGKDFSKLIHGPFRSN